jgi:dTDP-4-amino-4,6-dideoxygalactose transaminase
MELNVIQPFDEPIFVTRPFLPSRSDFCEGLKDIWDSKWLTNNGPVVQRFTGSLAAVTGTDTLSLFTNGTLALQIGLQAMEISGEVITTPFTFAATIHALHLNRIRPVFVDIEPDYYTLDPEKVEAAITPSTSAILPVHVYGHPCRLDSLAEVARRHNLRLIYDAAHAFGVTVDGQSIARFGDLSMFSFHATKLFHSLEGGMLVFADSSYKATCDYLKNFGFQNELEVVMPGTNAKMNEMQALMGELVLRHVPAIISRRRTLYQRYQNRLSDVPGIRLVPSLPENVGYNYAYITIEVDETDFGMSRDQLYESLKRYNVFTRRYFYPLVCDLACYRRIPLTDPLVVARAVAERILALPIYHDLALADIDKICSIIKSIAKVKRIPTLKNIAKVRA